MRIPVFTDPLALQDANGTPKTYNISPSDTGQMVGMQPGTWVTVPVIGAAVFRLNCFLQRESYVWVSNQPAMVSTGIQRTSPISALTTRQWNLDADVLRYGREVVWRYYMCWPHWLRYPRPLRHVSWNFYRIIGNTGDVETRLSVTPMTKFEWRS